MNRIIEVHVDLGTPVLAGRLHARVRRARESATFLYEGSWLGSKLRLSLDPVSLPLGPGPFHTMAEQALFQGLGDSAPDRWGRMLMRRAARLEGGARTLFEVDYLLGVHDLARQGALRFREEGQCAFSFCGSPIPPLVRLAELLQASQRVEDDAADLEALRLLLAPGSSLGGARPKASVLDATGGLAIAKFPSRNDGWPVIVWEEVVARLAEMAGLQVAPHALVDVGGRGVFVARRFDREGTRRRPYLSAMSLIGATERGEHSYLEIADAIRQHGSRVGADLAQLWRRMVFNVLVSNTDDHLRNHGFLWDGVGWHLAPAFDMNPVPMDVRPREHALALDVSDRTSSLQTLLEVAPYFGLRDPVCIAGEVGAAVAGWRDVASAVGLARDQVERMSSAFEHPDARRARIRG